MVLNLLTPGRCGSNFRSVISEHMLWIKFMTTSFQIAFWRMPQKTYDDKSTLVQVMTRCWHQAIIWTNLYLHMASIGNNELNSLNCVSLQAQLVCMFRLAGCVDLQGRLARSLANSASTAVSCPLSGQGREQWESVLGHRNKKCLW